MSKYVKVSDMSPEQVAARYAQQRAWNEANQERRKAIQKRCDEKRKEKHYAASKAYRDAHPELFKERRKRTYHRDREYNLARRKAWGERNKEYCKRQRKQHDIEKREQIRAMKQRWNDANRDRINTQQRARRQKNREHYLQQFREWMTKHQDSFAELKRGKAPRRAAILQKWQLCDELCYICGLHLDRADIEMDHVLPRAHKGTNDIENLMPTHRQCNRRKNKRLDYPIARFDLVEKATVIKSAPRMVRRRKLEEAA